MRNSSVRLDTDSLEIHRPPVVGRLHDVTIDVIRHGDECLGSTTPNTWRFVSNLVLDVVQLGLAVGGVQGNFDLVDRGNNVWVVPACHVEEVVRIVETPETGWGPA